MGIVSWIVFGLLVGIVAKWIMPGRDPGGIILTILIGIAGALAAGYVGGLAGFNITAGEFSIIGIVSAIVGALILLTIYRLAIGWKGY